MDTENTSSFPMNEPIDDPTRRLVPLRERPWWREHAGLVTVLVFTTLILIELAIAVVSATNEAASTQAAPASSASAPAQPAPSSSARAAAPAAPSGSAAPSSPSTPSASAPTRSSAPVAPVPTPTVEQPTAPSSENPAAAAPKATTPRSNPDQATSGQPGGSSRVYEVRRGDTLASIAVRHGVGYQRIAADNAIADPDVIAPGQRLRITAPSPNERVIAPGDTLSGLASATGQSVQQLLELNPGISDPDQIPAGGGLRVRA